MDASSGQHLLPTRNLHEKFRSLILLTALVAGINKGHPTLAKSSELPRQSLEAEEPPINVALKSLATLLVRDDKDITLAAYSLPLAEARASADSMHLVAMEGVLANCTAIKGKPKSAQGGENGQDYKGVDKESEPGSTMRGKPGLNGEHHPYNYGYIGNASDPYDRDKDAANDCSSLCVLVNDSATSHLSRIDTWRYNLGLYTDPLPNHIATLEEYLAEYKKRKTPKERRRYFFRFAAYLVGQCWMKMRRRILHWSSQGFIHTLGKVNEEELRQGFSFCAKSDTATKLPKGRDSALGKLLVGMHEKGEIDSVIMSKCGRPELFSERLTNMIATFRELQEPSAEGRRDGLEVYNWETCWEFHKLLLATLLAYGRALDELGKLDTTIRQNPRWKKTELNPTELDGLKKSCDECAEQVRLCGIVLWRIAYSRALHHHAAALRGTLALPINGQGQLARYQLYTGFSRIPCVDVLHEDDDCVVGGWDGCGTGEDDEFQRIKDESEDLSKVFQEWLRWQVTHWAALENISSSARVAAVPQTLKISLVAVKYPNAHGNFQMEPWRTTMAGVLAIGSDQPWVNANIPKAEIVIQAISRYNTQQKWMEPWSNSIFYAFQNDKPINLPLAMHSEAALASLMKYVGRTMEPQIDGAIRLIQNLNQGVIMASNPCCPVCSALLDILRGNTNDFKSNAHHTTIRPVELPPWLPRNVMEKMVTRFQRILLGEVITMMRRQEPAHHAYNPSIQRGLRIASTNTDAPVAWDIGLPHRLQAEEASHPRAPTSKPV